LSKQFEETLVYLKSNYKTPSGQPLGSSGRRELIEAFCLDNTDKTDRLLK
jgi:hypothetical protein